MKIAGQRRAILVYHATIKAFRVRKMQECTGADAMVGRTVPCPSAIANVLESPSDDVFIDHVHPTTFLFVFQRRGSRRSDVITASTRAAEKQKERRVRRSATINRSSLRDFKRSDCEQKWFVGETARPGFTSNPGSWLCAVAMILLFAAGLQLGRGADSKTAAAEEKAKPASKTVLFLTWENVFKGRLEPMIEPARLSESGRKVMEGLETSWNRRFETNGHGTRMMMAPRGIRITVEKAQKEPLPLKAERPWETRLDSFSILREGPLLKCWYSVHVPKQKEEFLFQDGRAVETGGNAMCYAESTDGLHWTKPNLGVFSFNGSKENNIVSYANFIASVFRDDHGLPEERYKSFEFGKLPADELAKSPGGNMNTYCLYALVSPDGYHWRSLTNNPLIRHFCDTQNVGGWDPLLKKYVGFFRDHQGGRAISRGETDDFHSWPPPQTLLAPGPADEPDVDYYSNGYTTYPGQPSLRLLFAAIYHQAQDRVDTRLAVSLEGRSFS